jgi:ATP-dependent helicase/nuclease subunit A
VAKQTYLPDQAEREKIAQDLDATMLVEAAAGTGKTTWLVRRMVGLVRTGRCAVENLAAVTFTRKAAAELRSRFQLALEVAASAPLADDEHRRVIDGLRQIERCFIGTIHAFCARLLRERPVEAGVPPDFIELDEAADEQLRRAAWREHVATLIAEDDDILPELARLGLKVSPSTRRSHALSTELDELGLEPAELGPAFLKLAEYPDIDDWPAPPAPLPDLQPCLDELRKYAAHIEKLELPANHGNDKLMPKYKLLLRMLRCADLQQPADLMEILEIFPSASVVQKEWPGKKPQALAELARWEDFTARHAEPLLQAWREHRYEPALRAIRPAVAVYERLRRERRALNFQDLLLHSARLLREHPEVRAYFRSRFSHVLVDEFQDTDPIQAEVMLLLTASDVHEQHWQRCTPVPGSLFVVGDPKQSIYRFRRADIQTYQQVRSIIERVGGEVVSLRTNFRSTPPLIDWINGCFDHTFPQAATASQPMNRPMSPGRADAASKLPPLLWLESPGDLKTYEALAEFEADRIARRIRRAVDERWPLPRSKNELEQGWPAHATPGDFLIGARFRKRLAIYGRSLQQYGLPHVVTGGSLLNEVPELELLHLCLAAVVRPDNAIALVALLRSELFGVSDVQLYELRRSGGRFSYQADLPSGLAPADAEIFREAFERLQSYARWLHRIPAAAAIERIAADLGLVARACAAEEGDAHAGSFLKALELLRSAESLTLGDHVALLGRLLAAEETHDGALVRPPLEAPVRVMNLHQCKGLEAPFVFLVDPAGEADRDVDVHVDRSDKTPRGYLPIYGQKRGDKFHYRVPLLAQPPGWEALAQAEQQFRDAEEARMRYVAATRAGVQLVISQRAGKSNNKNPWQPYEPFLAGAPALADPGPIESPARRTPAFDSAAWQSSMQALDARWKRVGRLSYDVQAIKAAALPGGLKPHSKEEHGAEWGNAIHTLLEAAIIRPEADLRPLAISVLEAEELPLKELDEVLATIASVMASPLWKRARQASQRLTEVPLSYLAPGNGATGIPTILRGVIDLAFREPAGWIIVDYKSERVPASELPALVAYYRPQLEAYAAAWEAIVREPVAEKGLYFTNVGKYVVV